MMYRNVLFVKNRYDVAPILIQKRSIACFCCLVQSLHGNRLEYRNMNRSVLTARFVCCGDGVNPQIDPNVDLYKYNARSHNNFYITFMFIMCLCAVNRETNYCIQHRLY